jgi:hypothetical protein
MCVRSIQSRETISIFEKINYSSTHSLYFLYYSLLNSVREDMLTEDMLTKVDDFIDRYEIDYIGAKP